MTDAGQVHHHETRAAVEVPGFVVTWPKIATLAGAIVLSVGGGFWGLSNVVYQDLKDKVGRNESKNDALDALTSTIRESVAKQGAQLTDLDRSVTQLTDQIKIMTASLTDTRDRVVSVDAKLSAVIAMPRRSNSSAGSATSGSNGPTTKQ